MLELVIKKGQLYRGMIPATVRHIWISIYQPNVEVNSKEPRSYSSENLYHPSFSSLTTHLVFIYKCTKESVTGKDVLYESDGA